MLKIGDILKINDKGRKSLGFSNFYADQTYKVTAIDSSPHLNRGRYLLKCPYIKTGIYLYENEEHYVDVICKYTQGKSSSTTSSDSENDYIVYTGSGYITYKKSYYGQSFCNEESLAESLSIAKSAVVEKRGHPLTKIFK